MKTVKIAELKDRLSEFLRVVAAGNELVVTDRNRPVARILPISEERPKLSLIAPKVAFSSIRDRKWRRAGWGVASLEWLREERGEGNESVR
jgi:prevent-host-death family protein